MRIRHGRTTTIAAEPAADEPGTRPQITHPRPGHDCKLSGCHPHVCKPMAKGTIRGIHAILSGAFDAADAVGVDRPEPDRSAKPPTPQPSDHPGYLAGRCGQGDSRGPRAQRCPGALLVASALAMNVHRVWSCGFRFRAAPALLAFAADAGSFAALGGQDVGVAGVGVAPAQVVLQSAGQRRCGSDSPSCP